MAQNKFWFRVNGRIAANQMEKNIETKWNLGSGFIGNEYQYYDLGASCKIMGSLGDLNGLGFNLRLNAVSVGWKHHVFVYELE